MSTSPASTCKDLASRCPPLLGGRKGGSLLSVCPTIATRNIISIHSSIGETNSSCFSGNNFGYILHSISMKDQLAFLFLAFYKNHCRCSKVNSTMRPYAIVLLHDFIYGSEVSYPFQICRRTCPSYHWLVYG
jgi:hypothetical protein